MGSARRDTEYDPIVFTRVRAARRLRPADPNARHAFAAGCRTRRQCRHARRKSSFFRVPAASRPPAPSFDLTATEPFVSVPLSEESAARTGAPQRGRRAPFR